MAARVLQLLVKNSWVADNLRSLGCGKMYHLAYRLADMEPAVTEDLANGTLGQGVPAEVVLVAGEGPPVVLADIQIENVHDFVSYCRFDFRILRLYPYPPGPPQPGFLCRYAEKEQR